jgi:dienelactone hydrolase
VRCFARVITNLLLLVTTLFVVVSTPAFASDVAAKLDSQWQRIADAGDEATLWWHHSSINSAAATVLLVSGCTTAEITSRSRRHWTPVLRDEGYQVAFLQLLSGRLACPGPVPNQEIVPRTPYLTGLIDNMVRTLRRRPDVRASRIAIVGWSRRAVLSALSMRAELSWSKRLRAGVAFYPDCRYPTDARLATPALILAGLKQGKEDEAHCALMMRRMYDGRATAEQRVYPNAQLRFDQVAFSWSPEDPRGQIERDALAAATAEVKSFLRQHLRPEQAAQVANTGNSDVWTVDPDSQDADLPSVGRSLLDEVLEGGANIPFPFEALIARLAAHAGADYFGRAAVKQIFVPLGRSLQRNANKPDFFGSPRIVVAVDTEPADAARVVNLKDRLFLGYQPRAGVIEAISWNPLAGRFEFQIISNYRSASDAKLHYADRQLCRGCHQNAGPIFARAPWTETNANPRIKQHLQARLPSFHGIDTARLGDTVEHVDAATNRASLLLSAQRIWRDGCGVNDAAGYDCRRALAAAMLQYRLSGDAMFAENGDAYDSALKRLGDAWLQHWPRGISVPDADLPDHDPLIMDRLGQVPLYVDPLARRAPGDVWLGPEQRHIREIVASLAGLIDEQSVRRLDSHLSRGAGHRRGPRIGLRCRVEEHSRPAVAARWRADCVNPELDARVRMRLAVNGAFVQEGEFVEFKLGGQRYNPVLVLGGRIRQLRRAEFLRVSRAGDSVRQADLILTQRRKLRRVRLPDGNSVRIARLTLAPGAAELELIAADDFAAVENVIGRMAARRHATLSQRAFEPAQFLSALFADLGIGGAPRIPRPDWATPPKRRTDATFRAAFAELHAERGLQLLHHHCAACHSGAQRFPPGFLHGDDDAQSQQLRACAPRMLYRLGVWSNDAAAKSPMPPVHALAATGYDVASWSNSESLASLKDYLRSLLEDAVGQDGSRDYTTLPECQVASGNP